MSFKLAAEAQSRVVSTGLVLVAAIAIVAGLVAGPAQATLALIGAFSGFALYHASFGFTAAWRRFLQEGRGAGIRAQIVMLAVTIAVFFPLLHAGEIFGREVGGFVFPVGFSVVLGAFLFGLGMQLGGGCGSGTLYTVGGGSLRMVVTLAAFILGSLIAAWHLPFWWRQPQIAGISLVYAMGLYALPLALLLLATVFAIVRRVEIRRHGEIAPIGGTGNILSGPWPLVWGALALAIVNIATLLVAGRPWGITSAFALWGGKVAHSVGVPVENWDYFKGDPALFASVFHDATSVMDFGLMAGALAAAGLAGKFAPSAKIPLASLVAAILGGLLMGYGARLAFGCNIGAFFSGLASGSLHGLVWLLAALPGTWIGIALRGRFGL